MQNLQVPWFDHLPASAQHDLLLSVPCCLLLDSLLKETTCKVTVDHLQSRSTLWHQCANHVKVHGTLSKMDVAVIYFEAIREQSGGEEINRSPNFLKALLVSCKMLARWYNVRRVHQRFRVLILDSSIFNQLLLLALHARGFWFKYRSPQ